jgi:hypothetical protein
MEVCAGKYCSEGGQGGAESVRGEYRGHHSIICREGSLKIPGALVGFNFQIDVRKIWSTFVNSQLLVRCIYI